MEFEGDDGIKRAVKDWIYTKRDRSEELADGKLLLTFEVRSLIEVTSWVLSWSGNVRVRKPEALRKAVAAAARTMLELNETAA